jgi:DNA-binding NtrC family response regulator
MIITLSVGQLVRDRRAPQKLGIVVGQSTRRGKLRVRPWHAVAEKLGPPVAIATKRLEPIEDLTTLPLAVAKHLATAAFERGYLATVMERAAGTISAAARLADVDRTNFRRLLQHHGLHGKKKRRSS